MAEFYGWDIYREEGIKELKRIRRSKFLAGKQAMVDLIDRYIKFYESEKDDQIMGKTLYSELDIEEANNHASKKTKELREILKSFYNTKEGKKGDFRIYFIAEKRNYRLGVMTKEDYYASFGEYPDVISYNENSFFKIKYRPFILICPQK